MFKFYYFTAVAVFVAIACLGTIAIHEPAAEGCDGPATQVGDLNGTAAQGRDNCKAVTNVNSSGAGNGLREPGGAITAASSPRLASLLSNDLATIPGEVARIASRMDFDQLLQPAEIPSAEDDVGAFRLLCTPAYNKYDDPIMYPGQPGKSHLHTFFGNTLADANSTYSSLRLTGDSTCTNKLNRSAYWIAAMMNGSGKVVMPDYLSVYYKRMPSTDPRCVREARACIRLPRGLRYIFGYNILNPSSTPPDINKRWWNCDTTPLGPAALARNPGGHYATIGEALIANGGCPTGARLGAVLAAPDCWDGKNLDSANHRSHMAYRYYDGSDPDPVCPRGYPYIIPQFTLGEWFTVDGTVTNWYLSSDRMPGMTPLAPGTTLHSDWFGAWDDNVLDTWTANCIEKRLSCSGGDLGNGSQMKMAAGLTFSAGRPLAEVPSR